MRSLYTPAAIAVLVLTQVAYAQVSISILGASSPTDTIKAGYVGSGVGGLSCSELAIALSVLCLMARATDKRAFMIIAAAALTAGVGYDVLTISSHTIHASAGGAPIDDLIGAHIAPAWGAWAMLVAVGAVALSSFTRPGEAAEATSPGTAAESPRSPDTA
jgi:hypothetical protein